MQLSSPPWARLWKAKPPSRAVITLEILAAVAVSTYLTSTAMPLFGPLFWASYLVSWVIGFLMLPIRVAIPSIRERVGPFVSFRLWAIILIALFVLTSVTGGEASPLAPVLAFFPGVMWGIAFNLVVTTLLSQKPGYCPSCKMTSGLAKDFGQWYCTSCGSSINSGMIRGAQTARKRPTKARRVSRAAHAKNIPKISDPDDADGPNGNDARH